MKDSDTKSRFIELRAANWSYQRIANELGVSKPTLIAWGREQSHVISNLRAIALEEVQQKYLAAQEKRIEFFGETLKSLSDEFATRDLKQIPTERLLALILKYSEALKRESTEMEFSQEETAGLFDWTEESTRVVKWKG